MDDASIPLQVQSPQIANPIATYGKLLSLRTMQAQAAQQQQQAEQQQQMFPEQLKQAQLANQERTQAIKDQEIFAKAYRDSQGDLSKTVQLAAQNGASGKGIMQYNGQLASVRQKLATTDKTTLANDAARHDQLRGRLEAFRAQPDDYKEKNWSGFMEQAAHDGLLKPDEQKQWLGQYPEWNNDQAEMISHSLASGHQLTTEAIQDQNAKAHAENVRNSTRRADAAVAASDLKTEAQRTKDAATLLGTASDPEDYAQKLYSLDPKIRDKFKGVAGGDEFDQTAIQKAADRVAMTPEERTRADQAEATGARTEAHQRVLEGQGAARVADAKIRTGLAVDRAGKEKSGDLTPYQKQQELDKVDTQEQRLHGQRRVTGSYLANSIDEKGKPLSGAQRDVYQKQLSGLNDSLQQVQVKKASLHGIAPPPPAAIARIKEGTAGTDPSGHVWKKQDGIVYFVK